MNETGDVSEETESNVDDGVGGADPGFDPDCACAALVRIYLIGSIATMSQDLPAMGGKKTASTARKTSELHMAPRGDIVRYHLHERGDGVENRIRGRDGSLSTTDDVDVQKGPRSLG